MNIPSAALTSGMLAELRWHGEGRTARLSGPWLTSGVA